MRCLSLASSFALLPLAALASPAVAQDRPAPAADDDIAFDLGQIIVIEGRRPVRDEIVIDRETLSAEAIRVFERPTLDEAAKLIPGVTAGNSGGSRNERLLFVRGFDRFQVPLSIDGIRVYLPVDNRLDFGRFLTPDVAEIQVAKGYPSVLDGPGAIGGAVNLVTRTPTRAIEAEARATFDLDRGLDYAGWSGFALLGTRQDRWYAQASVARTFTDHWDLPGGFVPIRPANEDGGARDFSRTSDWRGNLKLGLTPNATDEYVLSYTRQEGEKNAPLHISDTSNISLRNWKWPSWDLESLYLLTTTALSDTATLRVRAYRNRFENLLQSFDNRNQDSQTLPRSFDSPYDDEAWGGSAQLSVAPTPLSLTSIAAHFRRDDHSESQTSRPDLPTAVAEPEQRSRENIWSIAAEHRQDVAAAWRVTLGASFDWRDTLRAEDFGVPPGGAGPARLFSYPLRNASGWNAQGRVDWGVDRPLAAHASVSSRVRFPTQFERFSSQFGSAVPNPDLDPERATLVELGGRLRRDSFTLSGAVFYSRLEDALVTVRTPANLNRRENLGTGDYYGAEIAVEWTVVPTWRVGANYSFIERDFDVGTAPADATIRRFELTDVPGHKGFAWASWEPLAGFTLLPSMEFASDRTTVTVATGTAVNPVYYDTGGHVLAAFRASYAFADRFEVSAGVRNIFDRYYILTDGFPEPGRSAFVGLRAVY